MTRIVTDTELDELLELQRELRQPRSWTVSGRIGRRAAVQLALLLLWSLVRHPRSKVTFVTGSDQ